MENLGEKAKLFACGLSAWIVLASPVSFAEAGNDCPPCLALSPECWPPQCQGAPCGPCDILEPKCPNKDDYFIIPPRPTIYVVADGAAFTRVPSKNFDFAWLGLLPTGWVDPAHPVLSTGDFDYDFTATGRFMIGYTLNECLQIEGSYLGVSQGENSAAVRDNTPNDLGGVGNLFSPFGGFGSVPVVGLDYNNLAAIRYTSSLHGAELNVRRQVPMPPDRLTVSILFGVRYFGLPEELQYATTSTTPTASATSIQVVAQNELVGPQVGARFELYADNRWWINFEGKAAVMNNRATQTTTFDIGAGPYAGQGEFSRRESHTSFVGDIALTFVYRWSPSFTTRLGYQALWLTNMALAPDNLNSDIAILTQGPAQLNHTPSIVYHGPFAGLEFGW